MVFDLIWRKEDEKIFEKNEDLLEYLRKAKSLAKSYKLISNNRFPLSFFVYASHVKCAEGDENVAECIDIVSEHLEDIFRIEMSKGTSSVLNGLIQKGAFGAFLDQVSFVPSKSQDFAVDILMKFIIKM